MEIGIQTTERLFEKCFTCLLMKKKKQINKQNWNYFEREKVSEVKRNYFNQEGYLQQHTVPTEKLVFYTISQFCIPFIKIFKKFGSSDSCQMRYFQANYYKSTLINEKESK
ncbi:hypothetical protein ABPG72_004358 [Tetrahymena utriculariae]